MSPALGGPGVGAGRGVAVGVERPDGEGHVRVGEGVPVDAPVGGAAVRADGGDEDVGAVAVRGRVVVGVDALLRRQQRGVVERDAARERGALVVVDEVGPVVPAPVQPARPGGARDALREGPARRVAQPGLGAVRGRRGAGGQVAGVLRPGRAACAGAARAPATIVVGTTASAVASAATRRIRPVGRRGLAGRCGPVGRCVTGVPPRLLTPVQRGGSAARYAETARVVSRRPGRCPSWSPSRATARPRPRRSTGGAPGPGSPGRCSAAPAG